MKKHVFQKQTYLIVMFDGRVFLDMRAGTQIMHDASYVVVKEGNAFKVTKDMYDIDLHDATVTLEAAMARATYHVQQAHARFVMSR